MAGGRGISSPDGDLAIVDLGSDAPAAPATFAPFSLPGVHEADEDVVLFAHGFPKGYKDDGIPASFVVRPAPHIAGGVVPVDTRQGVRIAPGFSGTPAYFRNGLVTGMIRRASNDNPIALVLPLASIEHHWPPLSELVPLGEAYDATAYQRLREILPGHPRTGQHAGTDGWTRPGSARRARPRSAGCGFRRHSPRSSTWPPN